MSIVSKIGEDIGLWLMVLGWWWSSLSPSRSRNLEWSRVTTPCSRSVAVMLGFFWNVKKKTFKAGNTWPQCNGPVLRSET